MHGANSAAPRETPQFEATRADAFAARLRAMKRKASAANEARRRLDRLRALRGHEGLHDFVIEVLTDEGNPEIVLRALEALRDVVRPSDRLVLLDLYAYFDENGPKRDPSGPVRVEALRSLWHARSREDVEFAKRAARKFEPGLNGNGEMIRAAGLALLGAIDQDAGAFEAARVLGTRDASRFSGEPSTTAIRLLASLGQSAMVLMYALDPPAGAPDLRAEAIRSLGGVPIEFLTDFLVGVAEIEDETVLVALADLAIDLPPAPQVSELVSTLLTTAPRGELYEFLASSVVASRRQDLIDVLVAALPGEMSQKRLRAAHEALQLAPPTDGTVAAIKELESRLAKQASPS